MMFELEVEGAMEKRAFSSAAVREYKRQVVPLAQAGKITEVFFRSWIQYWISLSTDLFSLKEEFLLALEPYSARQAAVVVARLFDSEAANLDRAYDNSPATYEPLLAMANRLRFCWSEVERALLCIDLLRVEASARASSELLPAGDVVLLLLQMSSGGAGNRIADSVTKGLDFARLAKADDQNAALIGRLRFMEESLVRTLERAPDLVVDSRKWILSMITGWQETVLQDLLPALNSSELISRIAKTEDARQGLATKRIQDGSRALAEFNDGTAAEKASAQAAADRLTAVDALVRREQLLRQRAQGKFGSAFVTELFGADAGSVWEGLSK